MNRSRDINIKVNDVSTSTLLPLEEYAKSIFVAHKDRMPDRTADYWARYAGLVAGLREHVYPHINAGLSCLSKSPGIYTDHGPDHFDEVVRYAGDILGIGSGGDQNVGLTAYEIYLLLCAIRLHDAGNIDGRDDHEKRAISMLYDYGGNIAKDSTEALLIGQIADAHGGQTLAGSKDTIAELPPDGTPVAATTCRPRQVAALVRFADEICEHSSRAARHHLNSGTLPAENKLFHIYAESVTGAACDSKGGFKLQLGIKTKYLIEKYPHPKLADGKYVIDEVFDRISKLDCERRYCNQYLDPGLHTRELDIRINLIEEKQYGTLAKTMIPSVVKSLAFRIPSKDGYPAAQDSWRTDEPEWQGQTLADSAKKGWT